MRNIPKPRTTSEFTVCISENGEGGYDGTLMGHYIAVQGDFHPDTHALAPGYFRDRMTYFEQHYRGAYRTGWGEFFAAYSNGLTDKGNLDYDEWAFLCEHFMREADSTI